MVLTVSREISHWKKKLNTKRFQYHWLINDRLYARSGKSIYYWNNTRWIKSKDYLPLIKQPIIFEDDDFIVYGDCHGEWGGTVYFYEKSTSKTFFTESTCSNSIIKDSEGYQVLAHLGHGRGSTEVKSIKEPRKLSQADPRSIGKRLNGAALGYSDSSNAFLKKLDYYGIQLFSSFNYGGKVLYIVNLLELTFIAEISDNKIKIINPLFFNNLYTHRPVTKRYGSCTLMNIDFWGIGFDREISLLFINGSTITKIDWNKNHNR